MTDTLQTINRSARRFFSGTLLSRLSGMLRDISMAYVFGTQPSIAAFMVAFRFAHLLRRLFGEGALQSAFIPEFESLRQQDENRAFNFFRDLSTLLTLFLTCLIVLISLGLIACLKWIDFSSANKEIMHLTLWMLPSLLFICLFGLNASLLQCEKSYFIPSVAPVAFNGIWIASVLLIRHLPTEIAMSWLAIGVVIACFCQWLLTVPSAWKLLKHIFTSSSWHSYQLLSADLLSLGKPLILGIVGVASSQINNAMDAVFARYADPEGPAFLWYAIRLQQLPLALFGIAIAGAVLPPLSRAIKNQRMEEYHHFLQHALGRTWMFMLPFTAALLIMGDSCVNLIYGRGDFNSQSIIGTSYCLWAYSLGLIPSALVLVLAPASYAQHNYRLPAFASCLTMLLNIFLNTLFIIGFGWGAISVALATSLSAWVNFFILSWYLSKNGTPLFSNLSLQQSAWISFITLIAFIGTYLFRLLVQHHNPYSFYISFSNSLSNQFQILSLQALIFGGIFSLGCVSIFQLKLFFKFYSSNVKT